MIINLNETHLYCSPKLECKAGFFVTEKISQVLNPGITKQETRRTNFIHFSLFLREVHSC